jgi:hypothetical protein
MMRLSSNVYSALALIGSNSRPVGGSEQNHGSGATSPAGPGIELNHARFVRRPVIRL